VSVPAAVDFRHAPAVWQTAICLPDDWQKTLVGKDGSLLYDYPGPFSDFRTRIRADLDGGTEWTGQELASPRIPIVRTRRRAGSAEVTAEAFALPTSPHPGRPSDVERVGSGTTLLDWASPPPGFDPAFRSIAVGYGQPVQYRVRTPRSEAAAVVLGLCEGWHREKGRRILDLKVEGAPARRVDMVAEHGANVPALFAFPARDEDGDGWIQVAVSAAPVSPDANTILNVLWVFHGGDVPDLGDLARGAPSREPFARVACGQDAPDQLRADVLVASFRNAAPSRTRIAPVLVVDSQFPVRMSPEGGAVEVGTGTRVVLGRRTKRAERTPTGLRLHLEPALLRAGQVVSFAAMVLRGGTGGPQRVDLRHPARLRRAAERFWRGARLPYDRIQVPDPGIQALLDASIRNIYQAREIKNGLPAFQVGPRCYRGLWVVDGSFLLEAAAFLGRGREAREGIRYLLDFQREDGGFSLIDGHWKETGIALWAATRHARLTGDRAWLETVWPRIQRGFAHIVSLRRLASADASAPNCGLIPEGFSDGGLGGRYPEYTNVYWTLVGMKAAVEAARWLDRQEEADRWQRELDDMAVVFRRAAARDQRDDGRGNRFLPIRMQDDEGSAPQKAQWAFLHAVFPGRLFPRDDPLVQGNLAMLEAVEREGLILGTGWLSRGIWTYFGSFYAHAWLWQGRGGKAARILYAFANHASPLLAWREEQMPSGEGPEICGDMPHNWASAEFIRLVRHLLALERGDELHLLEGLPREWIRPGGAVRLRGIATEFGEVSLSLAVSRDGRTARLVVDPPRRSPPSALVVHLGSWAAEPGERRTPAGARLDLRIPVAQRALEER